MTRGRRGSLLLRRRALPSPPPSRFIPAHPLGSAPTAIRRDFTATTGESAGASRDGTRLLADSAAWSSPYRHQLLGDRVETRLHMFRTRARTGLMLPVRRTPPGQ